ncbi:unnamed protein product [Musa textilis]
MVLVACRLHKPCVSCESTRRKPPTAGLKTHASRDDAASPTGGLSWQRLGAGLEKAVAASLPRSSGTRYYLFLSAHAFSSTDKTHGTKKAKSNQIAMQGGWKAWAS